VIAAISVSLDGFVAGPDCHAMGIGGERLAVPRGSVLAYPEEVRRLLGYDWCPPGLGWYEMEAPYTVLAAADPGVTRLAW
jgi:hypothetical protein